LQTDATKAISLNDERVKHWLSVGAQPTDTVGDILAKRGLINAEKWNAARAQKVKKKIATLAAAKEAEAAKAAEAAAGAEKKAE
jgi:small subunit ribosomal protein S16